MADDAKTYVFDSASKGSTDPATLLALMNNGGGLGGNMSWIWVIFLFFLYGWRGGNGLFGGDNGALGRDFDTSTLLNAISGNGNAISNLATSLNCSVGQIQNAINAVNSSVTGVGNQVGMSGMQVINAIQSGNQTLASQLANCCCENKLLITSQGYESRLSLLEQTSAITGKIDSQTTFLADKFGDLEKRELQNKIDALREQNSTLQNTISNAQQTSAIQSYVASIVNPIAADVAEIKAAQPNTVSVQWPQLSVYPNYLNSVYGLYPNNGVWA